MCFCYLSKKEIYAPFIQNNPITAIRCVQVILFSPHYSFRKNHNKLYKLNKIDITLNDPFTIGTNVTQFQDINVILLQKYSFNITYYINNIQ